MSPRAWMVGGCTPCGWHWLLHRTASRTRAEVVAEAVQAAPNFKNFYVAPAAAQPATVLTRAAVREEARVAIRAHEIATGNFS